MLKASSDLTLEMVKDFQFFFLTLRDTWNLYNYDAMNHANKIAQQSQTIYLNFIHEHFTEVHSLFLFVLFFPGFDFYLFGNKKQLLDVSRRSFLFWWSFLLWLFLLEMRKVFSLKTFLHELPLGRILLRGCKSFCRLKGFAVISSYANSFVLYSLV